MAHGHQHDDYVPPPDMRHETRDFSTRLIVVFAVSLLVAAVLVHVAIWGFYVWVGKARESSYTRQYPLAAVGPPPQPPAPRLQTRPREELKEMLAEEEKLLQGYSWSDPAGGRVRIPIDRAMQLLVEQGLPARAGTAGLPTLPQDSSSGRTAAPRGK
jgi:hypothetical protein